MARKHNAFVPSSAAHGADINQPKFLSVGSRVKLESALFVVNRLNFFHAEVIAQKAQVHTALANAKELPPDANLVPVKFVVRFFSRHFVRAKDIVLINVLLNLGVLERQQLANGVANNSICLTHASNTQNISFVVSTIKLNGKEEIN